MQHAQLRQILLHLDTALRDRIDWHALRKAVPDNSARALHDFLLARGLAASARAEGVVAPEGDVTITQFDEEALAAEQPDASAETGGAVLAVNSHKRCTCYAYSAELGVAAPTMGSHVCAARSHVRGA